MQKRAKVAAVLPSSGNQLEGSLRCHVSPSEKMNAMKTRTFFVHCFGRMDTMMASEGRGMPIARRPDSEEGTGMASSESERFAVWS